MTNYVYYLAHANADHLPFESGNNILIPKMYDLVWSIIPFVVILLLLYKFAIPKYQSMLTQREDRIKNGIEGAEAAQAEAKAALEKYNAQLAEARSEAADIREQARERGKAIEAEMKEKANEESSRIVESGTKQLQAQREQVVTDLRREMGQNSINLAEQLLGTQLSDDVKRSGTIDRFLAGLSTSNSAGK